MWWSSTASLMPVCARVICKGLPRPKNGGTAATIWYFNRGTSQPMDDSFVFDFPRGFWRVSLFQNTCEGSSLHFFPQMTNSGPNTRLVLQGNTSSSTGFIIEEDQWTKWGPSFSSLTHGAGQAGLAGDDGNQCPPRPHYVWALSTRMAYARGGWELAARIAVDHERLPQQPEFASATLYST